MTVSKRNTVILNYELTCRYSWYDGFIALLINVSVLFEN